MLWQRRQPVRELLIWVALQRAIAFPSRMAVSDWVGPSEPHQSGVLPTTTIWPGLTPHDLPTRSRAKGYDAIWGRTDANQMAADRTHGFANVRLRYLGASYPGGKPPDNRATDPRKGHKGTRIGVFRRAFRRHYAGLLTR